MDADGMVSAVVSVLRDGLTQAEASRRYGVKPRTVSKYVRKAQETMRAPRLNESTETVSDPEGVYNTVLVLSDLHMPYHHPDSFRFLAALKEAYKPDLVVNVGDELDYHAISFHDSDPDLMSPGDELVAAQGYARELAEIFPKMDLVSSNHGDLAYRRGKHAGMPRWLLKSYRDVIFPENAPDWNWHPNLVFQTPHKPVFVCHGMKMRTLANVLDTQMCFIQGHHHGTFEAVYAGSPMQLVWGMTVGCMIDSKSYAFNYNKTFSKRPIIGCGVVIDGFPKLLPMPLDDNGRWTGVVT